MDSESQLAWHYRFWGSSPSIVLWGVDFLVRPEFHPPANQRADGYTAQCAAAAVSPSQFFNAPVQPFLSEL